MEIRIGELAHPEVIKLLQAHHNDMLQHSPVESVHALDVSKLAKVSMGLSADLKNKIH